MPDLLSTLNLSHRRGSLRLKLTIWMVAIFLVIQVTLAFIFYLYQTRAINQFFDKRVAARAQQISQQLVQRMVDGWKPDDNALYALSLNQRLLPEDLFRLDLVDDSGNLVASSMRPGVALPRWLWEKARRSGSTAMAQLPASAMRMEQPDPYPTRCAVHPFASPSGERLYIVTSLTDNYAQQMLGLVKRIILISLPIGLVATGVSAYLIAGLAVRPLLALRSVASQMSPESIGRQFEVPFLPVTEEVAAVQRELEAARQRLDAGFHAQERFMSNVSHELKTPIATILTEAQTLRYDGASPQIRDFVVSLREELEKLGRMVDSFLLLTRVRHGRTEVLSSDRCPIRDVLFDSFESCSSMAGQYGVRIDLQLAEETGDSIDVVGNSDLLRTIFDNIIRNAIRFTPAESVILVRSWVNEASVLVSVRDYGPGIPADLLPKIFDRFSQAPEELRRGRGHGLGLEIAQGVAELHSGSIAVRNCEGGGCEFVITLPLAETIAPSLNGSPIAGKASDPAAAELEPGRAVNSES